jgi:cellulose synthase/poly-beta-1,6-N-acetylglucosamine synthase-like glycosyltransferase
MAEHIFWISFVFVAYVYAGYPALLALWARLARREVAKGAWEPRVSLVIAAYDERRTIERKILNCLELDYPKDRLQIIVSLDGPTDGTEAIVRAHHDLGIEVIHSQVHHGKAAALNAGVRAARGEIVVFADARQRLDRRAVRELVACFADSRIGAVSGELVLLDANSGEASDAVGLYWRYEKKLRAMESRIHSLIGATGSIYAIRRGLYRPLPEDTILDDVVVPMRLVLAGWRSVFEPRARAYDAVAPTPEVEYSRKVRTLTGNFQLLADMPELLVPWRNPVWLQFVSHKVGRLLVPYFLIALLVSNLFLSGLYVVPLVCQVAWYGLAAAGAVIHRYCSAGDSGPVALRKGTLP